MMVPLVLNFGPTKDLTTSQLSWVGGRATVVAVVAAVVSTLEADDRGNLLRDTTGVSAALLSGSDINRFSRSGSPPAERAPLPTTTTLPPPLLLLLLSDFLSMDFFFCSDGLETRLLREFPASKVSVEDIELRLPLPEKTSPVKVLCLSGREMAFCCLQEKNEIIVIM